MGPLLPIIEQDFLNGWNANNRYEAALDRLGAETRFNGWLADVETLFYAAGIQ
jgi:hypothetical protein